MEPPQACSYKTQNIHAIEVQTSILSLPLKISCSDHVNLNHQADAWFPPAVSFGNLKALAWVGQIWVWEAVVEACLAGVLEGKVDIVVVVLVSV